MAVSHLLHRLTFNFCIRILTLTVADAYYVKFLIPSPITCIQKLIAYDHLEGDPGLEGGENAPLFTDILNMICSCVDNLSPDRY